MESKFFGVRLIFLSIKVINKHVLNFVQYFIKFIIWFFRYIPNPAQVLGEVLASGKEMPEEVEGEILAGDAVELNVLTMEKWDFS